MNGFLLVDKPSGMTSHDVVAKIRKRFGTKKVGHAGTLDPMATGVLVLGLGVATRLLPYVTDGKKEYDGTIRLGASTHTDDREGDVLVTTDASNVSDDAIQSGLKAMVGTIMQRPSSVSAIKVDGKTAHQRVRDGEVVELPAREVTIESIAVNEIRRVDGYIDVDISVNCSAGTYIRSIARDLGESLHVGGHLTALRRTLVAPFAISECGPYETVDPISVVDGIKRVLPVRELTIEEMREISFGRQLEPNSASSVFAGIAPDGNFAALITNKDFSGKTLATPIMVAVKE